MNKEQIIEAIESMTVLELSELVKALEEKFGVSAAAPVAVAAAPAAGGAGGLEHQFRQCPLNGTPGGGNPVWRGPGRDSRCHRMADPSSKDLCGSDFRRRTGSVWLPSSDFFFQPDRGPLCAGNFFRR